MTHDFSYDVTLPCHISSPSANYLNSYAIEIIHQTLGRVGLHKKNSAVTNNNARVDSSIKFLSSRTVDVSSSNVSLWVG